MDGNKWDTFRSVGAESDEVESCREESRVNNHKIAKSQIVARLNGGLDGAYPKPVRLSWTVTALRLSSESALWGWGCSAAALGATWRSVLGSAAEPAWWEQPGGQKEEKKGANITPHTHAHRRIKHLKVKSKVWSLIACVTFSPFVAQ